MGHYDDAYAADADRAEKRKKAVTRRQMLLLEKFVNELHQGPGISGIPRRHMEALDDMHNALRVSLLTSRD